MNDADAAAADPERRARREQIVAILRASDEPMSVASIVEAIGVHPNTVRFHLNALADTGRVERLPGDTNRRGRPPTVYRMSPAMNRNGPSNYRLLATMLTSHFATNAADPQQAAVELGRAWGPAVIDATRHPGTPTKTRVLTAIVEVLADLGFEPEPHGGTRTTQIRIRHCPFLDIVDTHAEVICSLHLGLMQGAFAALAGPDTVDRLEPFVEPNLCVAHVAPIRASPRPQPRTR